MGTTRIVVVVVKSQTKNENMIDQKKHTSGYGECSKIVFGNSESCTVVSCNANDVPGSWFQIEDDKVAAWFDVVRHLIPFVVVPKREMEWKIFIGMYLNDIITNLRNCPFTM